MELDAMRKLIHKGDNVLDIGANVGFITHFLSGLVGSDGHVYSFEPDPNNFLRLEKLCRYLPNVRLFQAAVGKTKGSITLYASSLLNVDNRTYPIDNYKYTAEVPVFAIDEMEELDIPIRFIKMDIQGAEYMALQGMVHLLEKNRDIIVLSELSPFALKEAGSSASQMLLFFFEQNFRIWMNLSENRWTELNIANNEQFDHDTEETYYNILISRKELNL